MRGLGGLAVLLLSGSAWGYVRGVNKLTGMQVRWPVSCIQVAATGVSSYPEEEVQATMQRAVDNWQRAISHCSYMRLSVISPRDRQKTGDGVTTIAFGNDGWEERPGDVAVTNLSSIKGTLDASVIDADIEVNANLQFAITPNMSGKLDLENTLTHELGHVLGLAHTCLRDDQVDGSDDPVPLADDRARQQPPCHLSSDSEILTATMYPYDRGTTMRTVEQDDVDGICETYPITESPPPCYGAIDGGCSLATPADPGAAGFFCALFFALGALRRRSR